MKKIIFLLIFSLGLAYCGPADDEIQSQIDDAVNQALETTTTESTTTTSVDPVYEDCLKNALKYKQSPLADKRYMDKINLMIQNCEFAINAIKSPVNFEPINLGDLYQ